MVNDPVSGGRMIVCELEKEIGMSDRGRVKLQRSDFLFGRCKELCDANGSEIELCSFEFSLSSIKQLERFRKRLVESTRFH